MRNPFHEFAQEREQLLRFLVSHLFEIGHEQIVLGGQRHALQNFSAVRCERQRIAAAIAGVILFFLARRERLEPAWFVPGACVAFLGEALRIWAAGHLRKNKQLTTTGPYSYVKNPLYIGTLLLTLGYSAMAMNYLIMAGGFVWFFIYYAPYKKKQENEKLISSFGNAWIEYDKMVPDYVPRLTPFPGRGENRWSYEVVKESRRSLTLRRTSSSRPGS